jgi:membrane protein
VIVIVTRARALVRVLRVAWREYQRDYANYFALAMVYYALVSLVPLLLLVLATLGLLLRVSSAAATAEDRILLTVQASLGPEMRAMIHDLLERLREGSVVAMGVSIIGLLVTASALFRHLRLSFRALWKYDPPLASGSVGGAVRETLMEQVTAFVMVLTAGTLLILTLGFIAVVHWLSGFVGEVRYLSAIAGWLLALTLSLSLATLTFALLFRFLPPVSLPWRQVWLASVLCGVAWIVGAELLGLYASLGDSPYGVIGGLLVVILWLKFVSQVLFYGAEVCKVTATT